MFPGAIYRHQHSNEGLVVYRCEELTKDKAVLRRIADVGLYTRATTEIETTITQVLTQPYELSLADATSPIPLVKLTLASVAIAESTIGYQLLQKKYELTCLNPKCLKHKEPLHNLNLCPFCQQKSQTSRIKLAS